MNKKYLLLFFIIIISNVYSSTYIDEYSLVQLLWKDEILEELSLRKLDKGIRSKSRSYLAQVLVENTSKKTLLHIVKDKLKSRNSWRSYKLLEI